MSELFCNWFPNQDKKYCTYSVTWQAALIYVSRGRKDEGEALAVYSCYNIWIVIVTGNSYCHITLHCRSYNSTPKVFYSFRNKFQYSFLLICIFSSTIHTFIFYISLLAAISFFFLMGYLCKTCSRFLYFSSYSTASGYHVHSNSFWHSKVIMILTYIAGH